MWFGSPRTLILRGLVTIAFGVLLVALPAISLSALILLFGAFALVDGALILTMGLRMASGEPARPVALVAGALAVIVGIATFSWPGLTEVVLLVLVALRAMMIGIAELITASWVGRHSSLAWFLAALGLMSIAFGALLLVYPRAGVADWTLRDCNWVRRHCAGLAPCHALRVRHAEFVISRGERRRDYSGLATTTE